MIASIKERFRNFNWGPGLFIIAYHIALLIGLPLYFIHYGMPWKLIIVSTILMYMTGLATTMGYHRLYSHMTYKANPVLEAILLFFATMGTQGSAIRWSFDHRYHHSFIDSDRDPYAISRGFWYAHFLWLFEKPKPIDPKVVADLYRNPLLRFQHKHYVSLLFATNILTVAVVGYFFSDYIGAILFAWLTRMFFLHHFTWFINSLAHTWGSRHFSKEHSAVDNYIIALLTFGEGYHNYHHTFAYDYRNGIRWFHFDPTKWLIWTLSKVGLAKQLRVVQKHQIQEKLLLDKKEILLEKIHSFDIPQKEECIQKVGQVIDDMIAKTKQIKALREAYLALKKNKEAGKEHLRSLKLEIKAVQRALKQEYRNWTGLSQELLSS